MSKNILVASALFAAFGTVAYAQSDAFETSQQASLSSPTSTRLAFPSAAGVPSAVAPVSGSGFVGLSYVTPRGGIDGQGGDGDLAAGYSVGDPIDAVSFTFGLAVTGLEPLGDAGSFRISASRILQAQGKSVTFLGASASNLAAWGPNKSRDEQFAVYSSHLTSVENNGLDIPMQFVFGYGTENTLKTDGTRKDGAFAGFGVGLTEIASAGMSFTETQLNLGVSVAVPNTNIGTSFSVYDVTDNRDRKQYALTVAYGFSTN